MKLIRAGCFAAVTLSMSTTPSFSGTMGSQNIDQGNWYIAAELGPQWSSIDKHITVDNGSGYPAPYNLDQYSTKTATQPFIGFEGGYRWQKAGTWLPAYSLGLRYKHAFAKDIGLQITQYSLPEFTNYNYDWQISSDVVLAAAKLSLFKCGQLFPYLSGGVGVAFNHASKFSETALAGVTPRLSPLFHSRTRNEFAYTLGAGVDWQAYPQLIASLGYEFQDVGRAYSGYGVGTWDGNILNSGSYQSNSLLLRATYLLVT